MKRRAINNGHCFFGSRHSRNRLRYFLLHPRQYFSAGELYALIWEKPSYGDVRTVQVHMHNLRKKLEDDPANPKYLRSEWGKGYFFDPEPDGEGGTR